MLPLYFFPVPGLNIIGYIYEWNLPIYEYDMLVYKETACGTKDNT